MPTFQVSDPTSGQILKLTGDSPPTEAELEEIFASQATPAAPEQRPTAFLPTGEGLTQEQRQQQADEEFGFLGEAVQNIPSSAVEFGRSMIDPILSPIQTAKSIGELGKGLFSKLIPGTQPSEAAVDAVGEFLEERYGGIENIKETIAKDPVGFMADLSLVFTAGATAGIKGLQATGQATGVTAKAAKAAQVVGKSIEPVNFATMPLRAVSKATPQQFINKMFESSAKFTTRLPDVQRSKLVNTALNEGIVLSRSGLGRLQKIKRNVLENVDDIIDQGVATGKGKDVIIKTEDLIGQLDDLKDYLHSHPLGADFADKVDDFADTLKRNPKIGTEMSLKQAQETKKILGKFFDSNLDSFNKVNNAAQDAIRRGIKSSLEDTFPEIGGLNKRASELIALEDALEPAINRIRNRDIFGLGSKLFAAGGLDTPARFFATLSETVLGDPKVKSRIAIALNKARKKPLVAEDITKSMVARQAAFQADRLEDILGEEETTTIQEGI
jgi:hypothetical protein